MLRLEMIIKEFQDEDEGRMYLNITWRIKHTRSRYERSLL